VAVLVTFIIMKCRGEQQFRSLRAAPRLFLRLCKFETVFRPNYDIIAKEFIEKCYFRPEMNANAFFIQFFLEGL
jgi:hypothetical protein